MQNPFLAFALTSVGTGNGLIPYLALREANQEFLGKGCLLKLLDSRSTGVVLAIFTICWLAYALLASGDWYPAVPK